jgi:hypothetical protein
MPTPKDSTKELLKELRDSFTRLTEKYEDEFKGIHSNICKVSPDARNYLNKKVKGFSVRQIADPDSKLLWNKIKAFIKSEPNKLTFYLHYFYSDKYSGEEVLDDLREFLAKQTNPQVPDLDELKLFLRRKSEKGGVLEECFEKFALFDESFIPDLMEDYEDLDPVTQFTDELEDFLALGAAIKDFVDRKTSFREIDLEDLREAVGEDPEFYAKKYKGFGQSEHIVSELIVTMEALYQLRSKHESIVDDIKSLEEETGETILGEQSGKDDLLDGYQGLLELKKKTDEDGKRAVETKFFKEIVKQLTGCKVKHKLERVKKSCHKKLEGAIEELEKVVAGEITANCPHFLRKGLKVFLANLDEEEIDDQIDQLEKLGLTKFQAFVDGYCQNPSPYDFGQNETQASPDPEKAKAPAKKTEPAKAQVKTLEEVGRAKRKVESAKAPVQSPEDLGRANRKPEPSVSQKSIPERTTEITFENKILNRDLKQNLDEAFGSDPRVENRDQLFNSIQVQLLHENYHSLNYFFTREILGRHPDWKPAIQLDLINYLNLIKCLRGPEGDNLQDFQALGSRIIEKKLLEEESHSLLVLPIVLPMSLLSKPTLCDEVLRVSNLGKWPNIHSVAEKVANISGKVRVTDLSNAGQRGDVEGRKKEVTQKAKDFQKKAGGLRIISRAANKFWVEHFVNKSDSDLHHLITPALKQLKDKKSLQQSREIIETYSNEGLILARLQKASKGKKISIPPPGRKDIYKHMRMACEIAQEWLDTISFSRTAKNFSSEAATEYIKFFDERIEGLMNELVHMSKDQQSLEGQVAKWVSNNLDNFTKVSKGEYSEHKTVSYECALNSDLFKIPHLSTDLEDDEVNVASYESKIFEALSLPLSTWNEAHQMQCLQGSFKNAYKIRESFLDLQDNEVAQELEDSQREEKVVELDKELGKIDRKLTKAVYLNLVGDADYEEWNHEIKSVRLILDSESSKDGSVDLFEQGKEIDRIDKKIQNEEAKLKDKLVSQLDRLKCQPEEKDRVLKLLQDDESKDFHTAEDYVNRLKRGGALPDIEESGPSFFQTFFPNEQYEKGKERYDYLYEFLDKQKYVLAIGKLKRGATVNDIRDSDGRSVETYDGSSFRKLFLSWFDARRDPSKITLSQVADIFQGLGFRGSSGKPRPDVEARATYFDVTAEPIADRAFCPVPTYGSKAKGRYVVMCKDAKEDIQTIASSVSKLPSHFAKIILYFGRLEENSRRDFAHACKSEGDRGQFLIIDDVLALHLATESENKLSKLFCNALPFSFVVPYSTIAGKVPPECFFGRERQRRQILGTEGSSCFVYGGRQLGKTALLRSIENEFHQPLSGQIGSFIDLKIEGLGKSKPINDLWPIIHEKLQQHGVIKSDIDFKKERNTRQQIKKWLGDDHKRRILIFLDEADKFLEIDQKSSKDRDQFEMCSLLKGTMDETDQRFKIVFAGLNNVLRTTQVSNHPLAHFGEPICIGPMIANGEARQASNLVKEPLAACGYFFENEDLISSILSRNNFYPSLIQIYCDALVSHLQQEGRRKFEKDKSPPYIITRKHLDEIDNNSSVSARIKDNFNLTLQLDPRYKLVANIIGESLLSDPSTPMPSLKVLEDAKVWWGEAFDEVTILEMNVLLEEMCSLGVLKKNKQGHYSLRAHITSILLGNLSEIQSTLLHFAKTDLPEDGFDPRSSRRNFGDSELNDISTLTYHQEDLCNPDDENAVRILVGNGSECSTTRIVKALEKSIADSKSVTVLESEKLEDFSQLSKTLTTSAARRSPANKDKRIVYIIKDSSPWGADEVLEFIRICNDRNERKLNNFVTVILPSDLEKFLGLKRSLNLPGEEDSSLFVFLKPLHETALRDWLSSTDILESDREQRNLFYAQTGNWLPLLKDFERNFRKLKNWDSALDETAKFDETKLKRTLKIFSIEKGDYRDFLSLFVTWEQQKWEENELVEFCVSELKKSKEQIHEIIECCKKVHFLRELKEANEGSDDSDEHILCYKINPLIYRLIDLSIST